MRWVLAAAVGLAAIAVGGGAAADRVAVAPASAPDRPWLREPSRERSLPKPEFDETTVLVRFRAGLAPAHQA